MTKPIDRRWYFLLSSGQRRVQRWVEGHMSKTDGITAAQAGLLFFLGSRDGALIGEAAEALDVAPSAMTGLVDRSERAGLVERRPDAEDGRSLRLHLTERGREARSTAKAGLTEINEKLTDGFSAEEMEVVSRWLTSLSDKFRRAD
ncbi:MarR family winged helix-turn-helix transcriptional regulator [Caulobacter sp. NIBR2454]|uniref:MarR family winged helix-turn-helix transcriptional regulator n=1 Tax=Caulobacter sp. NIBR2454 TaxID=3015996 RepID=UPI0022B6C90E|nr:MarR family transcriptional regulator [Caulobacter sp. NIBR2454]